MGIGDAFNYNSYFPMPGAGRCYLIYWGNYLQIYSLRSGTRISEQCRKCLEPPTARNQRQCVALEPENHALEPNNYVHKLRARLHERWAEDVNLRERRNERWAGDFKFWGEHIKLWGTTLQPPGGDL